MEKSLKEKILVNIKQVPKEKIIYNEIHHLEE